MTRRSTSSATTTCASCPGPQTLDQLAEDWDHHKYAICHYVVFPNTVFNCNPEHIQVFNPIPIDVDRTRFLCWEMIYPGDLDDPSTPTYYERTMAHWDGPEGRRRRGHRASTTSSQRTKRSSGYTQHILNERECKIAHYHETMDRKIRTT